MNVCAYFLYKIPAENRIAVLYWLLVQSTAVVELSIFHHACKILSPAGPHALRFSSLITNHVHIRLD